MDNTCSIKYDRRGTTLEFEHAITSVNTPGLIRELANAGFKMSFYNVRNGITGAIEQTRQYWYIGYNYPLDDIQWMVQPIVCTWRPE